MLNAKASVNGAVIVCEESAQGPYRVIVSSGFEPAHFVLQGEPIGYRAHVGYYIEV